MRAAKHIVILGLVMLGAAAAAAASPEPAAGQAVNDNHLAEQPTAGTEAVTASYLCYPNNVAVFENRIHVRCTTAAAGGISYFAFRNTDAAQAARHLSLLLVAYTTDSGIWVYYDPNDTSGDAWGCNASDCRVFTGVSMVK
jgi:hypothetical protein